MYYVHMSNEVFHAIAEPHRRRILDLLAGGEKPVLGLLRHFKMSQPALSQHLKVLRDAGVVHQRKVGRQRFYSLNAIVLKSAYDWLGHYERFWTKKLDALGNYLEKQP